MDISIVSGTYNRLSYLQRMVESARASLAPPGGCYGLSHELVIVDGGSQDGTQDWLRQQPDVRLIEHGRLLGAVRAFNDGAYASQGDYVVLANDDVEFLDDTVWRGWVWMNDHPDCGIGCFRDDRLYPPDFRVDRMPVVIAGQQASAIYGQVCIVPKWLGDRVGWWGDYLHTYGGDNEISSCVYDLGYKVQEVPGSKVHDSKPDDDLRKANNISGAKDPRAMCGHHPDSWAWGRRWRGRPEHLNFEHGPNLVGPVVKDRPQADNPLPSRPRVLYLPIFEAGWPVQKEQKRGLREALAEAGVLVEYDYVGQAAARGKAGVLDDLTRLLDRVQPTLVLTQLHNGEILNQDGVKALREHWPHATWANWNGDYWPENLLSEDGVRLARAFDWQLTVNRDALDKYQALGVRAAYWQIGFEPDGVGHEPPGGVRYDLVFLANGYSKDRHKFVSWLRKRPWTLGLWGSGWPDGWAAGQCLYDFKAGCAAYRSGRICLGDSQWPDSGFVSNRVFQALAAGGSALAHQWFRDMERLGLVDGETVIVWRNLGELEQKVGFYLANEPARRGVAEAGQRLALERHSFRARVRELLDLVGQASPQREAQKEDWRW